MSEATPGPEAGTALADTKNLYLGLFKKDGAKRLMVYFADFDRSFGGLTRVQLRQIATAADADLLLVVDRTATWYNKPGLYKRIRELLAKAFSDGGYQDVTFIGAGMGGFGAMLFAKDFTGAACLVFSPHASIDPEVVPEETRWPEQRAAIGPLRFKKIGPHLNAENTYFVLHSDDATDAPHAKLIPIRKKLSHFLVSDADKGVIAALGKSGVLRKLILDVMDRKWAEAAGAVRAAGGKRKALPGKPAGSPNVAPAV